MRLPADWNPLRLQGDHERGEVSIADLSRARLAFRWTTPSRNLDLAKWADRTLRDEVGALAAGEAREFGVDGQDWRGAMLYVEPKPPGRDVWVALSPASGRLIEIVYSCRSDDHELADRILPSLRDSARSEAWGWRLFDLSCTSPAGYRLKSQLLNAGDLSLAFSRASQTLVVRQIALAKMALARRPLVKWLGAHERSSAPYYAPVGSPREIAVDRDGDQLVGVQQEARLRQRFAWMWWLPRGQTTLALHDEARDRIVIVQGSEGALACEVAGSVGA